jgi:hypothetical protein
MKERMMRSTEERPLIAIVEGIEAERFMVHKSRREQLRRLCELVGSGRNYTAVALWLLDQGAIYEPGVEYRARQIAEEPDIACSERTVQRGIEFWRDQAIVEVEDREDDNGGSLPPRAKLVWGSVLRRLAGESPGSVRAARSAEELGARRPVAGAGPPGFLTETEEGGKCTAPAPTDQRQPGAPSATHHAPSATHRRSRSLAPSATHGNGEPLAPSATREIGRPGGGVKSEGGGDKIEGGSDRKRVTPGVTTAPLSPPLAAEPLLERAWRDPANLLGHARLLISTDDDDAISSSSSVVRVRALDPRAGPPVWAAKFLDGPSPDARVIQRLLHAAAWLAETCFSAKWLLRAIEGLQEATKGPEQFRPVNPRSYLASCLRNACWRGENVGPWRDERDLRAWFAELMDLAEGAVERILPPPPATPPERPAAPGPAANSPEDVAKVLAITQECRRIMAEGRGAMRAKPR